MYMEGAGSGGVVESSVLAAGSTAVTAWLPYRRPGGRPEIRLLCFPHAGGAASAFRSWGKHLSPEIEVCAVQLPGRETRLQEEPHREMAPLLDALTRDLAPLFDEPFALFGHSLGGLIAFELARRLAGERRVLPARLFVSAFRAPHLPNRLGPFAHLPDDAFAPAMRDLGTTPDEVFDSPELLEIVLPILRADFTLAERYAFDDDTPLDCDISVLGGTEDALVLPEELMAWSRHTRRRCATCLFPGGHFYVDSARVSVLQTIRPALTSGAAKRFGAP